MATACFLMCLMRASLYAQDESTSVAQTGDGEAVIDESAASTNEAPKPPRLRDPFWRVGYVPREIVKAQKQAAAIITENWDDAEQQLNVSAIQPGPSDRIFAIVNGKVLEPGGSISVLYRNFIYTWKVRTISKKDGIKLDRQTARHAEKHGFN